MTNTIKGFLNKLDEETIRDIANYGVQSGIIGELIYNVDVVNFFDAYEQDIEAVITGYIEEITGQLYYDLMNYELMSELMDLANVSFRNEEDYWEAMKEKAEREASNEYGFDELSEEEQDEIILGYASDTDIDLFDDDKTQFVNLAVELVAQQMTEAE